MRISKEKIQELRDLIEAGVSTREAASRTGMSNGRAWFYAKDITIKQVKGDPIEYKGVKYYPRQNGYYRSHGVCVGGRKQRQRYIHIVVYEDNFGPVPEGHEVHHKDTNKKNNEPSNLEAIANGDHQRHHWRQRRSPTNDRR